MEPTKCTILVCSSDGYEDAWYPFFKLFKKNWPDCPYEIILNTESKTYAYDGLNIKCLQLFKGQKVPYGTRMIAHLKRIDTPYTLVLMDDFFIRKPVDEKHLHMVMDWLSDDPRAVVFSFQAIEDELNKPSGRYKGYNLRPIYGEYKFNFQAAIWKTKYLLKSWKKHETPWEWETIANFRSFTKKYDFYSIQDDKDSPIDYGFRNSGMGIFRGKWVVDTVQDLFFENGIDIDFSVRGEYSYVDKNIVRMKTDSKFNNEMRAIRSSGVIVYTYRALWRIVRIFKEKMGKSVPKDYIEYKRKQMED